MHLKQSTISQQSAVRLVSTRTPRQLPLTYGVTRVSGPLVIDADFEKPLWQQIEPLEIACVHPSTGAHCPGTHVKMCYDDSDLYMIFRVEDRYVRAVVTETHGPVWQDSCVEFFFTPYVSQFSPYFNVEVNCIGTFLMNCQSAPGKNICPLNQEDCQAVRSAASLSGPIPLETDKPVTWTVEYALPFAVLRRYAKFDKPSAGATWRANFYKCADHSSRPHWLTWSPVPTSTPDFHRPEHFGRLEFK